MNDHARELITLSNGARIVLDPMPGLATAAVNVSVAAGARHEAEDKGGLAHFLEHMTFKGAGGLDARAIAEKVEDKGGQINAATEYERTSYSVRCMSDDAVDMLDHALSLVFDADLPASEMELEKGVVLQEIGEAADEPDDRVFELVQQTAWPDHALGRPILGTDQSVKALSRDDLVDFVDQHYSASQTIVSLSGAFDAARARDLAERRLAEVRERAATMSAAPVMSAGQQQEVRDLEQTLCILSHPGPDNGSQDRFAGRLMVEILGGGMASRLFQEVRERRGLAYAIDAYSDQYSDAGRISVFFGCEPDDAKDVAKITSDIWADLAMKGPTQAELARAKAVIRAQTAMSLETPGSRAASAALEMFTFNRLMPVGEALGALDAVTAEDVRRVAENAVQGQLALAQVGPAHGMISALD